MLTDEVIDEDIEALLYAQVYYGKSDTAELAVPEQVETPYKEDEGEIVNSKIQEPEKLSEEQIHENNLRLKEHQDGNQDQQVNTKESQDQHACDLVTDKPISNSIHTIEASEKQDRLEVEPQSQSETTQQYIQISTTAANNVQTEKEPGQIPHLTGISNAPNQQLLNNITINQYICPGEDFLNRLKVFKETIIWSKKCEHDYKRYKKGVLDEKAFFNILKRRRKFQKKRNLEQDKIRKAYFEKRQKINTSEIICLSDSDNSDVELVSVEDQSVAMRKAGNNRTKTKKSTAAATTLVGDSSDDDSDEDAIIYVEPPPVPVINIEDGTDSEPEASKEASAEIQDDASNDFLVPTNTSEQFNFTLHGSEFQNAAFVRPTDPTDAYETESSTTTSDFNKESNREFSNSVKTIVFDEVDFPREDIFEGSNLDKFGELITPQRGSEHSSNKIKEVQIDRNIRKSKRLNPRTSSESSSESEYEAQETHRNLPDLSPMIGVSISPRKGGKNKVKPSAEEATKDKQPELRSRSSKKCKQNVFSEENDGILDADGSENTTENVQKKSKKRSSGVMVEENSSQKKIKKKKTAEKNIEEPEVTVQETIAPESSGVVATSTPKRSSKELPELILSQSESSKKKNKKKKKQAKTAEDNNVSVSEEETASSGAQQGAEGTNKKSKKRKVNSKTEDQDSVLEQTAEEVNESLILTEKVDLDDRSKRKAKKQKQRRSSAKEATFENVQDTASAETAVIPEENSLVEASELVESDEPRSRRKRKRNKKNSSNKANSDEATENTEKSREQSNEKSDNNNVEKEVLDPSKTLEASAGDKLGESQEDEEEVVIIERAVPVHTIESSDSEDDDIMRFNDLSDELKLANISGETSKPNESLLDKLDITYIKSRMSDDPDKWKILSVDQYNISVTKKGTRCRRCRQFGHLAAHCPNKSNIPSCTLCGYEGHQEPRCPNKVCFTCGQPGNYSTVFCYKCSGQRNAKCHLCNMRGHSAKYCPDLWRRYYLTIKEGPLITPKRKNAILIPRSKQWCSGCASRGHLEFECNSYKWIREYPTSSPNVFDYVDVYEAEKKKEDQLPESDLRNKLLQNRSRHNRTITQHENTTDNVQTVDKEHTTNSDSSYVAVEMPVEAAVTTTAETSFIDDNIGNQINITTESTDLEVPQPSNETEIFADKNVSPEEHQNQDQMMHHQVSSTTETTPQEPNRSKNSKRSHRRGKLNPLSVLKPHAAPAKFTPYHSVLNPYSLLGTPAENALNMVPLDHNIGAPFIDTVGAQQNVPTLGLFNQIPNSLLAQQVANLMGTISGYQQTNQMQYDFQQNNMYQEPGYTIQVPPSTYNWHDMNYFDVSQPVREEGYFENMSGQYFTHNNYKTSYGNSNRQYHRDVWTDENFRGRDYTGRNTPYQASSRTETYVPLSGVEQDIETYKPENLNNVEEATAKKFTTFSILDLSAFLNSEVELLDKRKTVSARECKQKLISIDHLKRTDIQTNAIKKQIYMQYKLINMYLFGVRRLADGKKHLDFLRNFVCSPGRQLQDSKRKALLNAYGYIFGGEHPNFNYRKYLNGLTVGRGR